MTANFKLLSINKMNSLRIYISPVMEKLDTFEQQGKPHSDGSIEVSHACREDYITFQICHHERIKVSKQSEYYVRPTEKT